MDQSLIKGFEQQLKQRLSQKTNHHSSEETQLLKYFKYFDLNNSGTVSVNEFQKVLDKLGVWLGNSNDLNALFQNYDKDGNGELNYAEFIGILYGFNNSRIQSARKQTPMSTGQGFGRKAQTSNVDAVKLVEKMRNVFMRRNKNQIVGIARQFKIADNDNSKWLNQDEFIRILRDFQVGLTVQEQINLFTYFDRDGNGQLSYDEFLVMLRGPMNSFRQRIVDQAFNKMDKNGNGRVEIDDLIDVYNVDRHPEFINGKKTKEQILEEFMSTFEQYSDYKGINDKVITLEEFGDYYSFISASIDDDAYFELMMNNSWRINEGADRNWNKKGWSNNDNSNVQQAYQQSRVQSNAPFGTDNTQQRRPIQRVDSKATDNQLLELLRGKIRSRGTNGIFALGRLFRNIDDNRNGTLEQDEFVKVLKEFRLGFNQNQMMSLFNLIDRTHDQHINYDEFLRAVVGEMNQNRMKWVHLAFKKLDKDGSGVVDIHDIKGTYNASKHPEVKAGRMTEDQVLNEWLDQFEQHHALMKGDNKSRDRQVTFDEFVEYYNNVSCSCPNDEYFQLMMVNAWQLDGHTNFQKRGYRGEL